MIEVMSQERDDLEDDSKLSIAALKEIVRQKKKIQWSI